jgi:sucrose-6F-phosphate phosphohydrolase
LPRPDYLIGALGTEIEDLRLERKLDEYSANLAEGWSRDALAALMTEMDFEPHEAHHQTPLKASFNVPGEANYRRVLDQLAQRGLAARVIYSEDKNLDLLPPGVDKGKAADYLRARLGYELQQVIVAGDGGNDLAMFERGYKSIIVANAEARLRALTGEHVYHAYAAYAAGVLEGLRHWRVLSI